MSQGTQWEPRRVTLAQLENEGQGDNANVVVTDYTFGPDMVVEQKEGQQGYLTVWAPAYPRDGRRSWRRWIAMRSRPALISRAGARASPAC